MEKPYRPFAVKMSGELSEERRNVVILNFFFKIKFKICPWISMIINNREQFLIENKLINFRTS